jgi:hypothetical protein
MLARVIAVVGLSAMLGACQAPSTVATAPACRPPLVAATMIELYFGRAIPGGGYVSDAEWNDFLRTSISPRFPAGLTVIDSVGQSGSRTTPERTKLVQLGVRDAAAATGHIDAVIADYKQRFRQIGVFRVESPVCASL